MNTADLHLLPALCGTALRALTLTGPATTSFNYYTNTIDLHLLPAAKLGKANSLESSGGTYSTTTIRLRSTGTMRLPRHP